MYNRKYCRLVITDHAKIMISIAPPPTVLSAVSLTVTLSHLWLPGWLVYRCCARTGLVTTSTHHHKDTPYIASNTSLKLEN